jgi:hypothetical protein
VGFGGFERLFQSERRQDGGQALGQHGFARAGRPDEQDNINRLTTSGVNSHKRFIPRRLYTPSAPFFTIFEPNHRNYNRDQTAKRPVPENGPAAHWDHTDAFCLLNRRVLIL